MNRRAFISLIAGASAAWPLAARAQQAGKLPTIGFLVASAASVQSQHVAAFVQRLRELGWIDGRTVALSIAGRRDAQNASLRSQASSSGSKSMPSSRQEPQPSRQSR